MALASRITGNTEIIQVAEAVAREKGIDRESVVEAIEQAIQVAARKKYGYEQNIIVTIDRNQVQQLLPANVKLLKKLTLLLKKSQAKLHKLLWTWQNVSIQKLNLGKL